jgi:hypothetical protein
MIQDSKRPHAVQFYDDEKIGMAMVSQFLTMGLRHGDAIIIIATPQHQRRIQRTLVREGLDVAMAKQEGWYICVDARQTLDTFTEATVPNKQRFEQIIGTVIQQAASRSKSGKVHAYGEMVALLCEDGAPESAIALERLWNSLATKLDFALFCSYPMEVIMQTNNVAIAHICANHTGVIGADLKRMMMRTINV